MNELKCPCCGSEKVVTAGWREDWQPPYNKTFTCKECGEKFILMNFNKIKDKFSYLVLNGFMRREGS